MPELTIGRAAKAAGVNVETIRFYERRGLIVRPPTPSQGYREYDLDTVERIRFIQQAQEIGFSLREIQELLALRADPEADCADVRARATAKLDDVNAKIRQLQNVQAALEKLISACPGKGAIEYCSILEEVSPRKAHAVASPGVCESFAPPKPDADRKVSIMKTTEFSIDGMHCDGCANTIEALLARLPGVRKADVSFSEKRARMLHDPNAASDADLAAAIGKGGFTAKANQE